MLLPESSSSNIVLRINYYARSGKGISLHQCSLFKKPLPEGGEKEADTHTMCGQLIFVIIT